MQPREQPQTASAIGSWIGGTVVYSGTFQITSAFRQNEDGLGKGPQMGSLLIIGCENRGPGIEEPMPHEWTQGWLVWKKR